MILELQKLKRYPLDLIKKLMKLYEKNYFIYSNLNSSWL